MASNVYRGTTPPFRLIFKNIDLTGWDVYITFEQYGKTELENELTVSGKDLQVVSTGAESCEVFLTLTQEQTLSFNEGRVDVQMRAFKDGAAVASKKKNVSMKDILLDGVIPLGGV